MLELELSWISEANTSSNQLKVTYFQPNSRISLKPKGQKCHFKLSGFLGY